MINTNDQKIFYGDNGLGIVLIHGITAGCAEVIPLGKMLNDYGYTVRCVNIAGHGTYPQELLKTSWEDAIDKAQYDYDLMKANYEKVYIGGISMGGCLSLALAARQDEVDGVLSFSAPLGIKPGNFVSDHYPEEQIYFHRELAGKQGVLRKYQIHYEDIATRVFDELNKLLDYLNRKGVLESIKCPVYIGQAQDDDVIDLSSGKEIYDRVSSRIKHLYTVGTGGHDMAINEGRFGLIQDLVKWLDTIDGILG